MYICVHHRKIQNMTMCSVHVKGVIIFLFLRTIISFGEQNPSCDADVINSCVDTTWCSHSYEQVYKSLTKAENNFNISHALYPGRSRPASVRVLISVYAAHKSKDSIPAKYTWSISCLYVSVPASVLQFLSLGSILITPRTQELILHIPQFCCNVSESRERREKIIDGMLTRALAELQDLAISPGIQNPSLNTAECVIKGHQPDVDATGVSSYIRAILYCSLFSVLLIGPMLGFYSLVFLEYDPEKKDEFRCCKKRQPDGAEEQDPTVLCKYDCCCNNRGFEWYRKEDPFMRPAKYICHLLLMTDFTIISLIIIVDKDVLCDHREIFSHIVLIICEGVAICLVQCWPKLCCVFCNDSKEMSFYRRLVFIISGNIIAYHLCWLIVGIMVNPTWGLTVLAVACFVIVALFCTIYLICSGESQNSFWVSLAGFLGLCLVVSLTVLAGQSFYGKETAGEILKTALLYVVGGLTGLLGKGFLIPSSKDGETQTSNAGSESQIEDADWEGTGERAVRMSVLPDPSCSSRLPRSTDRPVNV